MFWQVLFADWGAALGWVGGLVSAAVLLLLKAHLDARREERRRRRSTIEEDDRRRIETDRAIYRGRRTTVVRSRLATVIRSGGWRADDEELVRSLEQGAYEDFLDPEVHTAWLKLIAKTIPLVRKRKAGTLTAVEIEEYNRLHRDWEAAAKRSFGPLPETGEVTTRGDPGRRREDAA